MPLMPCSPASSPLSLVGEEQAEDVITSRFPSRPGSYRTVGARLKERLKGLDDTPAVLCDGRGSVICDRNVVAKLLTKQLY